MLNRRTTEDERRLDEKLENLRNVVSEVAEFIRNVYSLEHSDQDDAFKTQIHDKQREGEKFKMNYDDELEMPNSIDWCKPLDGHKAPGQSQHSIDRTTGKHAPGAKLVESEELKRDGFLIGDFELEISPAHPVDQTLLPNPTIETPVDKALMQRDLEQRTLKQDHSDSSEIETELDSLFSSPSPIYGNSTSSLASEGTSSFQDALEELASLFLNEFYSLINVALRRRNAEANFVSKFRTLLLLYGIELQQEAGNRTGEAAAKLIQTRAGYIAIRIQTKWKEESGRNDQAGQARAESAERKTARRGRLQTLVNDTTQRGLFQPTQLTLTHPKSFHIQSPEDVEQDEFEDDYQSDASSLERETDQDPDISEASLIALMEFMISSTAFDRLRNAFWRMVFPNPLHGIRALISSALDQTSESHTAYFKISWPVQSYLATELSYDPGIKKDHVLKRVLTITGRASLAYADTAEAYIKWKWPDAKINVLELVDSLLKSKSDGKLTSIAQKMSQII